MMLYKALLAAIATTAGVFVTTQRDVPKTVAEDRQAILDRLDAIASKIETPSRGIEEFEISQWGDWSDWSDWSNWGNG